MFRTEPTILPPAATAAVPFRGATRLLFLLLLGSTGMFLSEGLIWNVYPLLAAAESGVLPVALGVALATAIYSLQFAFFADLICRWRVRDLTAMILLGSVHGLLLEGVFADLVFRLPGKVLGLSTIGCAFPALSWHAALDFVLPFLWLRALATGRVRLDRPDLGLGTPWQPVAGTLFWFSWSLATLHQTRLPGGMPLWVQLLFVLYPILLFGVLSFLLGRRGTVALPEEILTPGTRRAVGAFLGLALVLRLAGLPVKLAALPFLALIAFYAGLFALWQRYADREQPDRVSCLFPFAMAFRPGPYLIWCTAAVSALMLFRQVSGLSAIRTLCSSSSTVQALAWIGFAGLFPVVVLSRLGGRWLRLRNGRPPQRGT